MEKLQSNSGQYPHSASLTIIEGDSARLAPGPGGPPPFIAQALPERYGMPLFELLAVDPDFVFVSWELDHEQLKVAREDLGEQHWEQRSLQLRFCLHDEPEAELARRELYGDQGRWFVELRRPDTLLRAELGFSAAAGWHLLASAGPLQTPRDTPVDGEFIELLVNYGAAPDGQLTLESFAASSEISSKLITALASEAGFEGWSGAGAVLPPAGSGNWSARK
jgi:hypothetical protein